MNNSIFNIVVAGILVVAWLWVLGRPVLSKISYLVRRMRSNDGGIDYVRPSVWSLGTGLVKPVLRPVRAWRRQTVFERRRQLLIALMSMMVASVGLVIVFRGPFLPLLGAVTLALLVYLNAAVRIGGRLVRWQNYVQRRAQSTVMNVAIASGDIGQIVESEVVDGTEKVDVAAGLSGRVGQKTDGMVDPTLKVKGSRRRKRLATKNPTRRVVFRRPGSGSDRISNSEIATSDLSHLDTAANDR